MIRGVREFAVLYNVCLLFEYRLSVMRVILPYGFKNKNARYLNLKKVV